MKRFPELWVLQAGALLILGFASVPMVRAIEQGPSGEYDIVESSRPDGKGGYRGKVTIKEQGPSFAVDWKLKSGENYTGVGILNGDILGVGYGDGVSGLAVYQIRGGTLTAKWLLPATPQQVGEYQLNGPASLDGIYRFANGMKGNVTIKPNGDSYDIVWNLPAGTYTGVGVKMGDRLVAVSGSTDQLFGAVAYHLSGERLQGIWTVAGQNGVGTEVLGTNRMTQPQEIARPGMEAATSSGSHSLGVVVFDGETYRLANSVSSPGSSSSELREFLLPGETFDNYTKLLGFRVQSGEGKSPAEFTQVVLKQVASKYPQAQTNEIVSDADSSTVEFLIINGNQVEYDLFHYFRSPQGLASVQFVLQNHPPYDTEPKFKAEKDAHMQNWVTEVRGLAPKVATILEQTRGMKVKSEK
jgi:hypothetical protein